MMEPDMVVTQAAGAGWLPAETDEFVGRTAELQQIDALLRDAPLVTLVGPGGVGKTRVALRAAAAAAGRYADGVSLVELSALRDPELLAHTIARGLGLAEQAAGSQRDALLGYLRDRRLLLLLDTCEHLIDACAELAEAVLAAAPQVTVLATSREPLDVAGETTFGIRPLPVGRPADGTGEDGAGDAVELFARRAAAALPGFTVTAGNRAEVARICRGVDGVPLAIEMAAGRLRDLTLAEVSGLLNRRLALLTGGGGGDEGGGGGGRHETARAVIAWSYDTCSAAERTLWTRLSVFPGRFSVRAAAEVCASGELSGTAILETIFGLVNKSLLVRVDPVADDQPGFRMLDVVREFGAERLAASGEEPGIRDRLLARYRAMARDAARLARGDNQLDRFAGLRAEHASVQASLRHSLEPRTTEAAPAREREGAELAVRLWAYWLSSGLIAEGVYWLGKALDRVTGDSALRAWLLVARSGIGAMRGSAAQAVADGEACVEIAERVDQPHIAGRAYACLCLAYTFGGQLAAAARAGEQAELLLAGSADTDGLILLDLHLAVMCQASGQPERSLGYYQRGMERFSDGSGERMYHGYLRLAGAFAYLEMPGREADCARMLSSLLLGKYDLAEVTGTAYGLELFGWLAARSGRHQRAAWLLGAADALWERLGVRLSNAVHREQLHAAAVAAASGALGDEEFAALFGAGRQHPLDELVALAINDADNLDGPVPDGARAGAGTLNDREREVAALAATGLTTAQVARRLFLPPRVVEEHLASVFGQLGVTSARQLGPWLGELPAAAWPGTRPGYRLPRRSCSRSIASNSAWKLPLPKPSEPCRSMNSKNTVGRSPTGLVKICSR
jgi:non-specific serine/threonine protein kinase